MAEASSGSKSEPKGESKPKSEEEAPDLAARNTRSLRIGMLLNTEQAEEH